MVARSQNGYSANDVDKTKMYKVAGTTWSVRLRKGNIGWLLAHFAAQFNKRVERIDGEQRDDWGYAERPIRGSSTTLSNHASGSAIDINALQHPLGAVGTFSASKRRAIRELLDEYAGVIRWGGDYTVRKDEMHFEVIGSGAKLALVRARLSAKEPVKAAVIKARSVAGRGVKPRVRYVVDVPGGVDARTGPGKTYPVTRHYPQGYEFTCDMTTNNYRRHVKPIEWFPADALGRAKKK